MDNLISVIVPVYNVEAYLPRCVDSILAQTYKNLEIILVDDGTKDRGGVICDEYAAKDSRVKVIHKENGGLSSARNAGIDVARGEYLAFVDSDDYLEPEAMKVLLDAAVSNNVRLACAGRYDVDSVTGRRTRGLCPPKTECISGEELVGRIFTWDGCDSAAWDKLYHRSLFREARYPVGKICEDVPTTYLLALDAGRAAMVNHPIYNYYHRPGSITTAAVSDKSFHLSEHTARMEPYILEHYPQLSQQVRYLRVRTLENILLLLEQADGSFRSRYAQKYHDARRALREHLFFIVGCSRFDWRSKLRDILLATGLYRFLRPYFTHKPTEKA